MAGMYHALGIWMAAAAIDAPQVSITIDPPEIPFHRQSEFQIQVLTMSTEDVTLPPLDENYFGMPTDGSPSVTRETLENGQVRMIHSYTLDPVHVKEYAFPPLEVSIGDEKVSVTPPGLHVRELTPEEERKAMTFAPIAKPADLPAGYWRYIPWGIGILTAGALSALTLTLFRRRMAGRETDKPPWVLALSRLHELEKASNQFTDGPFYVALSDIVRHYLEDRYAIHAPERTTQELLVEAHQRGVLEEPLQLMLKRILRQSDRVKFAQFDASQEARLHDISEVRRLIEGTVPKTAEADSGTEAA